MRKGSWLALGCSAVLWIALTECDGGGGGERAGEAESAKASVAAASPSAMAVKEEMDRRLKELQEENRTLRESVERYERIERAQEYGLDAWKKEYPKIAPFGETREWTSIEIIADGESVKLTDPLLLSIVGPLLQIQGTADYTNGPQSDIDPFSLRLTDKDGSYLLNVTNRESVEFPELDQAGAFRVSPEIANFGRAWMKRPSYVPEESLESRLINSGAMKTIQGEDSYIFMDMFRIRRLAIEYLKADKKKTTKPASGDTSPSLEATFYLYGQSVNMKVYPDRIELQDGKLKTSYEVGEEVAERMRTILAVG